MATLYRYLRDYWKLVVAALVLAAINQVFSLLDPLIFRHVIDSYATRFHEYTIGQFIRGVTGLRVHEDRQGRFVLGKKIRRRPGCRRSIAAGRTQIEDGADGFIGYHQGTLGRTDFVGQTFSRIAHPQVSDVIFQKPGLEQSPRRRQRGERRHQDCAAAKNPSRHMLAKVLHINPKVKAAAEPELRSMNYEL